jgi:hypothetical protein
VTSGEIDELDEISGDEQLALIWCDHHRRYSWLWVPISWMPERRRDAK